MIDLTVRTRRAAMSLALACVISLPVPAAAGTSEDQGRARSLAADLDSPFLAQRESSKAALVDLGPAAEAPMMEALRSPDPRLRIAAAEVLVRIATKRAGVSPRSADADLLAVLGALEASTDEDRDGLIRALVPGGPRAKALASRRLAEHPEGNEPLQRAVAAFIPLEIEQALDGLITERYSYGFYRGQFARIVALGRPAVPVLLQMYTQPAYPFVDSDPRRRYIMRTLAGEALADMGDTSVVPALVRLLDSDTAAAELAYDRPDLEDTVAYVLSQLREPSRLQDLMHRLQSYLDIASGPNDLRPRLVGLMVRAGQYPAAEQYYQDIIRSDAQRADWAYYNLACIYAIQHKNRKAIDALGRAIQGGFGDVDWIKQDGDLANLRGDPLYEELIREAEKHDNAGRIMRKK